ncbi:MAG: hypothetical protein Q9P14_00040 [candidate division KSB1 bacterium]|nr:hypothetical protein [candidate division KSB1 bacterium]
MLKRLCTYVRKPATIHLFSKFINAFSEAPQSQREFYGMIAAVNHGAPLKIQRIRVKHKQGMAGGYHPGDLL